MTHLSHPAVPLIAGAAVFGLALAHSATEVDPTTSPQWRAQVEHPAMSAVATALPDDETYDALVEQYCVRCHSDRRLTGNLTLESFSFESAPAQAEVAEKIIGKLRAGMMPPASARKPPADSLADFMVALEERMDEAARQNPNPGSRPFQRLNRAEYAATVENLLGVRVDVSAFLPLDTKSANFDNIADVQMPSATLMEGYLRAAHSVAVSALGNPDATPASTPYRVPRTQSQKDRVPGAPIGTRGGLSVIHNFPADGRYVFQVMLHSAPEGELFGRPQVGEQVEVSIDGERVAVLDIDRWMNDSDPNGMTISTDSIDVRAGARRVSAAFVKRFEGPEDDLIRPLDHTLADTQIGLDYGVTVLPHLQVFTIVGPYHATGVSDTDTRRRIFTCRPTTPDEARPCASEILGSIAERAYRRDLTDQDVDDLLMFYEQGAAESGFEGGIRVALQAILASPHFVFRTEEVPGDVRGGEVFEISDVDLASRLSYFLWGGPPDGTLIELADRGALSEGDELERQVRRMLADERASALATRFAHQWLRLPDLDAVHPDALDYPYYDHTLAEAMEEETEHLFDFIRAEDRSVMELITADYTFVNERLARHYEIPNVTGTEFRRVSYPDDRRRGVLGHGSVLTLTSHANRTSPVLRGKWVMEVLMGSPPPPPPPDVPELDEVEAHEEGRILTVRERMEMHRANPACNSCHRVIDPIGLALENFDVTGAWRVKDEGSAVDPVGELYDGSPIQGADDLRAALLARPEVFLRNFTTNLMAYALGRRVEYYDQPTIRAITRQAAEDDYALSSFVLGVVDSPAFRTARVDMAVDDGAGMDSNSAGQER